MKADRFLVMAHGTAEEVAGARKILDAIKPSRVAVHTYAEPKGVIDQLIKQQDRFDQVMTA